jgi:hypothetical protein
LIIKEEVDNARRVVSDYNFGYQRHFATQLPPVSLDQDACHGLVDDFGGALVGIAE